MSPPSPASQRDVRDSPTRSTPPPPDLSHTRLTGGSTSRQRVQWIGLIAGPCVAVALYFFVSDRDIITPDAVVTLSSPGRATLALMAWMAIWWLTEAIDVSATALLPLVVLPLATARTFDSASDAMHAAAAPYANHFIALFMGGFILALAMERWGLHKRIALIALRCVGVRPTMMIAGFMAISAIMSMWVSNTATIVMMLPIAISVTHLLLKHDNTDTQTPTTDHPRHAFALCLMLGIAYAASVGGIGTLIGTPPNLLLAGFLKEELGIEISFVRWMGVGLPLVAVFVPIIWFLLTRVIYPIDRTPIEGGRAVIRSALADLGPMKQGEWTTFIIFMLTAFAWITRPLLVTIQLGSARPLAGLTDAGIAMLAALALFVIPVNIPTHTFVMNWAWARRLPWGILILFGGGLSLASAVTRHGVADFLGAQAQALDLLPGILIVLAVAAGVILLTEFTSNTATTATLLPILASLAPALGLSPLMLLVPATLAASCAFMMPVATPPNAVVFASGYVTIPQMCRAGIWFNLIGVLLVTALTYLVALPLLSAIR